MQVGESTGNQSIRMCMCFLITSLRRDTFYWTASSHRPPNATSYSHLSEDRDQNSACQWMQARGMCTIYIYWYRWT